MKRFLISIWSLIIIFFSVNAQNSDSIEETLMQAVQYYNNHDIANATPLFESALREIPKNEVDLLFIVEFMLSSCYYQQEEYEKALPLLKQLDMQSNKVTPYGDFTSQIKLHLMNAYRECNLKDKSKEVARYLLAHLDEYDVKTKRTILVEVMTSNIADLDIDNGIKYANAALLLVYPCEDDLSKSTYDIESNTIHMALMKIYNDREDFENAFFHAQKAIENINTYIENNLPVLYLGAAIASDHLGNYITSISYLNILDSWLHDHPEYVQDNDFRYKRAVETGSIQLSTNDFTGAIISFNEALKYCQGNEDDEMYCNSKLFYCYENTGNIDAKNELRLPIIHYAQNAQLSSESRIITYHQFAQILKDEGNVNFTLTIYEKLLSASPKLYGKNSYKNFNIAYGYAVALQEAGRSQDAINSLDYLISMSGSPTGNRDNYISVLILKAVLLGDAGDVGDGIDLLASLEKEVVESDNIELKWNFLNGKSHLSSIIGDFESSLKYDLENLPITRQLYGEYSRYYGIGLMNISEMYAVLGKKEESIGAIKEALSLFRSQYGERSSLYYHAFSKYCHAFVGSSEEYDHLNKLIDLSKDIFGEVSKEYAEELIYSVTWSLNPSQSDIVRLEKALSILKELGLRDTEHYLTPLYWLSVRYFVLRDWDKLLEVSEESLEICRTILHRNFVNLTAPQREGFWNRLSQNIHYIPSYAISYIQYAVENNDFRLVDSFSRLAFNSRLLEKGLLLSSTYELDRILAESQNPHVQDLKNEISVLEDSIKYVVANSAEYSIMQKDIDSKYRDLLHIASENGDFTDFIDLTWEDVSLYLQPGEAAIEFFSYPVQSTMQYAAVWITHNIGPLACTLFTDDELSNFLTNDECLYDYGNPGLYKTIWNTIEQFSDLKNCHTFYFSPDNILNCINIEQLTDSTGIMACEKRRLVRVSSIKEVVNRYKRKNEINSMVAIFGGFDYDMEYEKMTLALPPDISKLPFSGFPSSRGCSTRARYSNLEWTLPEANGIASLFQENSNMKTKLFIGEYGSEEMFYTLSGNGVKILHLATHGFYFDSDEVQDRVSSGRYEFLSVVHNKNMLTEDKQLTHSGLLFSGANNILRGHPVPKDREDGILTAQELSRLDFSGMELVVLSACETGLGDLTSEGVFGLQRGFKKAGVESILMSLWEVNDEATGELMQIFYKNYVEGQPKIVALYNAQKKLKSNPRFSHPKYWAGWILLDAID